MIYSCIDIGGTAIKFGLVDETGRFHKKGSLPTEAATGGGPGIVHKVRSLIQRQLADHPLAGIGISTAGIIDTEIHASGGQPDRIERVGPLVPMKRAGTAEEVAQTIVWLLSDKASYMTGAIVDVSGGR